MSEIRTIAVFRHPLALGRLNSALFWSALDGLF